MSGHAYAVVRVDAAILSLTHPQDAVTVRKVLRDLKLAQAEADWLNLIRRKGEAATVYFVQATRLEE
jgi:hypothetical protein